MALPTFTPPVAPSLGTNHAPKVNLRETEFGDGYSQVSPKGLNHIQRTVSLKWDGLLYDDMRTIIDFLEARGGYEVFRYRPYGEPYTRKWTCKQWTYAAEAPWRVTAEFIQNFTLEN